MNVFDELRLVQLQQDVDERRRYYEQLASVERTVPHPLEDEPITEPEVESDAGYRYENERKQP